MTPEQKKLVQSSFSAAAHRGEELVDIFYGRLFEGYPQLRKMFPHDMEAQKKKLLQTLAYAVNGLAHPEALLPIVRDLGRNHRSYDVEAEHYTYVAAALIGALREALGTAFTHEVERAWVACYVFIAREMEPDAMAA